MTVIRKAKPIDNSGFIREKYHMGEFQMPYTVWRNDIFITGYLCFHITCFIRIFLTTPMFELVETVACMLYVVQETVWTQEWSSIAYRAYDFTIIQSLLYQWRNEFRFRRIPTPNGCHR